MILQDVIIRQLKSRGADFVRFVDISGLPEEQNRNYPVAVVLGIALSPSYLQKVYDNPNYVQEMIHKKEINTDEFHLTELKTDGLADFLAGFLREKGLHAFSQSEDNLYQNGLYDKKTKGTPLPHKTIAGLAGLGWIGKHNLLVTKKYGSAVSMCSVLCDAPLQTVLNAPGKSKCGECSICQNICHPRAIKGNNWVPNSARENIIDVTRCTTCLQCMVQCPWTVEYFQKNRSV